MLNKLQLMLDAHTLGMLTRNVAAMVNHDAEAYRRIWMIRHNIMTRYGALTLRSCKLKIAAQLAQHNE